MARKARVRTRDRETFCDSRESAGWRLDSGPNQLTFSVSRALWVPAWCKGALCNGRLRATKPGERDPFLLSFSHIVLPHRTPISLVGFLVTGLVTSTGTSCYGPRPQRSPTLARGTPKGVVDSS